MARGVGLGFADCETVKCQIYTRKHYECYHAYMKQWRVLLLDKPLVGFCNFMVTSEWDYNVLEQI